MESNYNKHQQKEEGLLEGFAKLGKAIGPFGTIYTMAFMANVVMVFMIIFLQTQFQYLWLVITIFCLIEIILAFSAYLWREKQKKER